MREEWLAFPARNFFTIVVQRCSKSSAVKPVLYRSAPDFFASAGVSTPPPAKIFNRFLLRCQVHRRCVAPGKASSAAQAITGSWSVMIIISCAAHTRYLAKSHTKPRMVSSVIKALASSTVCPLRVSPTMQA